MHEKLVKKFTLLWLKTTNINNVEVKVDFTYGDITANYYTHDYPTESFDTEEQAIKYAHEFNKYGKFIILPIYEFD